MTTIYNNAGRFQCYGVFVDRNTLWIPDSGPLDAEKVGNKPIGPLIKRSKRHHYRLHDVSASEHDVIYNPTRRAIHAENQVATLITPHLDLEGTIKQWIYHESTGAYRLILNTKADPRYNGCPVVLGDETSREVLGMAIAPLGFQGEMEVIPVDLVDRHVRGCYSYIQPCLFFQHVDARTCYHPLYGGSIKALFRHVDIQAERGRDVHLTCGGEGEIFVTGAAETSFPWLSYEPCIEVGPFVFQRTQYGKVSCVYELYVEPSGEEAVANAALYTDRIYVPFTNRLVKRIDDIEPVSFEQLMTFFKGERASFRIHWMDGVSQQLHVTPLDHTHGEPLSSYATLWFDDHHASVVAWATEQVKDLLEEDGDGGDDAASCTDVLDLSVLHLHHTHTKNED